MPGIRWSAISIATWSPRARSSRTSSSASAPEPARSTRKRSPKPRRRSRATAASTAGSSSTATIAGRRSDAAIGEAVSFGARSAWADIARMTVVKDRHARHPIRPARARWRIVALVPRNRVATSSEIELSVIDEGLGPLVVLCHGFPQLAYSWRHQIPALVNAGYRVIAPDMRGFGQSSAPVEIEAYDVLSLCGDLCGLLDEVG